MEATCPICMEPFTATELRSLTGGRCGHRHCGECLGGYLAAKVGSHEASEAQMHCPECATPGAVGDIEALLLQHVERGGSPTPSPAEPRCEGPRLVEVMVDATAAVAEGQPVEAEELAEALEAEDEAEELALSRRFCFSGTGWLSIAASLACSFCTNSSRFFTSSRNNSPCSL